MLAHPGSEVGVNEQLWWNLEVSFNFCFPLCGPSASSKGPSRPTPLFLPNASASLLDNSWDNSHLLKIAGTDLAVPQLWLVVALASFLRMEDMGGFLESAGAGAEKPGSLT